MQQDASTIYLSQIGDGAQYLNLLSNNQVEATLKFNLLFFDKITLSTSDLLGSPQVYQLMQDDPNLYRQLFRGKSSVVTPVLWSHNHQTGIVEVAKRMLQYKTIHSLQQSDDLLKHAEFIQDACSDYLYADEQAFRTEFHKKLLNAIETCLYSNTKFEIEDDNYKKIIIWLESFYKTRKTFTCTGYYNYLDESFSKHQAHLLKHFGEAFYHFSLSQKLGVEYSSFYELLPIVDLVKKETSVSEHRQLEREFFEVTLPIKQITSMKLQHILKIRNLAPFKKIRQYVKQIKAGKKIIHTSFEETLKECETVLWEFLFTNNLSKESYLKSRKKYYRKTKVVLTYDVMTASVPIMLNIIFPQKTPFFIATFVAASLFSFKQLTTPFTKAQPTGTGLTLLNQPPVEHQKISTYDGILRTSG